MPAKYGKLIGELVSRLGPPAPKTDDMSDSSAQVPDLQVEFSSRQATFSTQPSQPILVSQPSVPDKTTEAWTSQPRNKERHRTTVGTGGRSPTLHVFPRRRGSDATGYHIVYTLPWEVVSCVTHLAARATMTIGTIKVGGTIGIVGTGHGAKVSLSLFLVLWGALLYEHYWS